MTADDFRARYRGKQKERYNKCIRAEFEGGAALLELRRFVSYLRNVRPLWDDRRETRRMLRSILDQTPDLARFGLLRQTVAGYIDNNRLDGRGDEARRILSNIETILTAIRDDLIKQIKERYQF